MMGGKRREEQINPKAIPGTRDQEVCSLAQVFLEFLVEADEKDGIGQTLG